MAHTDLYINWKPYAPLEFKIKTRKNLVKRARTVDSVTALLHKEIEHLKAVFFEVAEYLIKAKNSTVQSAQFLNTWLYTKSLINIGK